MDSGRLKRSKEDVISHWRPFVHVMESDAFNPLTVPKYKILVREDGYHLISRGDRKEVRVNRETLQISSKLFEFLSALCEPISWLNLEAWILDKKVLCVEVWLDIVPFRIMANDKDVCINHLHTFMRSLSRLSQTTTLIYGDYSSSSLPSPWIIMPLAIQNDLDKRIAYALSPNEPPLTVSGVPGFRLPFETAMGTTLFFNMLTNSLIPSIEKSLFTWEICGCLQYSPHLCATQTRLKEIVRGMGDLLGDGESMDPILIVSHCPSIYEGEGTLIVDSWKDLSAFSLSRLLSVERVVLNMALYGSSRYSTYLEACVSAILEFPEELHSAYSRFVDMEEYCRHKTTKTGGGINHFDIVNARSMWHSSPHMQKVNCMPFEFGTWSLVFWEDIHAIPATHFSFMKAMGTTTEEFHDRSFGTRLQVGFTHTRGFSFQDREFMHHACIKTQTPHLPPFPNLRDIVDACFLCPQACWSWQLPIRAKRVLIDLSRHEEYMLQSHDIEKVTDESVSPLLVTASQDYISNPRHRLQISSQHELHHWLRNYFNGEIRRTEDRLERFKEKYKSELQTLVRMEGIPSRRPPLPPPPPRIPPPPPFPSRVQRIPPPPLSSLPSRSRVPVRSQRIPLPPRRVPPPPPSRPVTTSSSVAPITSITSSSSIDPITSILEPRMENPESLLPSNSSLVPAQNPSMVPPSSDAQTHLQFLTESMSLQLTSLRSQKEKLEHTLEDLTLQKSRSLGKLESVIEEWKEGTQCSLCFTDPVSVITPCLHSFCLLCVMRLFSSNASKLSDRNVRLAKCPHCKASLEVNKATFVSSSIEPHDLPSRFTVLSKVLDSKSIRLLCEVMKVLQEDAESAPPSGSKHLVICSSSLEEKNLMIGIRYLKNHSETPWDSKRDLQIVQRSDISFVYQMEPITHIWTTFHVSESFEEIPFFRYFSPMSESYPTVTAFEWRV